MAAGRIGASISIMSLSRCFYARSNGFKARPKRIENIGKPIFLDIFKIEKSIEYFTQIENSTK